MRRIAISLIVLVSASANASFDLMLLPSTADSQVRRFDPVNRIGLGSFGNLGVGAGLSVNLQSANNAYITTSNGTQTYSIGTGETIGGANIPNSITSTTLDGQTLIETFPNNVWLYNSNLGVTNALTMLNVICALPAGTGRIAMFGTDGGGNFAVSIWNYTAGTVGAWQTLVSAANFGGAATVGTGFAALEGGNMVLRIPYRTNFSQDVFSTLNFNGTTGFFTGSSAATLNGGYGAGLKSMMPGHAGFWVVGDDISSATTTRISKHLGSGAFAGVYTTTSVDVPSTRWSGANVVAPEPGTMIALGLGITALLKRKKS